MANPDLPSHTLTILLAEQQYTLPATDGANLRRVLLAAGFSPYTVLTRRANCGGRGLCATCGVWIEAGAPPPQHWHDRLAARFDYPRLSCQIQVTQPMTIRMVDDKRIWGRRDPSRRW